MGACMSRCMKGDGNSSQKPTRLQEYDTEYDNKTMVPLNEDPDTYTEIDLNEPSVKVSNIAVNKRPAESQIPFELAMVNSLTRQKLELNRPKMTETLELTPFTRTKPPPSVPVLGENALSSPKGPNVLFKAEYAKSPFQRHLDFKREKNNSTSSLYIKDSIVRPDLEELVRCASVAILYHIREGMKKRHVSYDIFNEERHPLTFGRVDVSAAPDITTVYRFIKIIFKSQKIASECAIMCLAFIERLIASTGITLYPSNWRRIVLGALILATKVWEEDAVWNADFIDVFPNLTVRDLNLLERTWLDLLQYNVEVSASQYAKYYFELRALSEIDSRHFPLKPLDQEAATRLERRSLKIQKDVRGLQRSKSVDHFTMKSPQVVLL